MLLCGEFVGASLTFVYREPINRHMRFHLQRAIKVHYNTSTDNNLMAIWDRVQNEVSITSFITQNHEDFSYLTFFTYTYKNNIVNILFGKFQLHCCGVDSYEDYRQIDAWPDNRIVPDSCCKTGEMATLCGTSGDVNKWWPDGCAAKLSLWLTERLHYLAIIGFLIAFIQVNSLNQFVCFLLLIENILCIRSYLVWCHQWFYVVRCVTSVVHERINRISQLPDWSESHSPPINTYITLQIDSFNNKMVTYRIQC